MTQEEGEEQQKLEQRDKEDIEVCSWAIMSNSSTACGESNHNKKKRQSVFYSHSLSSSKDSMIDKQNGEHVVDSVSVSISIDDQNSAAVSSFALSRLEQQQQQQQENNEQQQQSENQQHQQEQRLHWFSLLLIYGMIGLIFAPLYLILMLGFGGPTAILYASIIIWQQLEILHSYHTLGIFFMGTVVSCHRLPSSSSRPINNNNEENDDEPQRQDALYNLIVDYVCTDNQLQQRQQSDENNNNNNNIPRQFRITLSQSLFGISTPTPIIVLPDIPISGRLMRQLPSFQRAQWDARMRSCIFFIWGSIWTFGTNELLSVFFQMDWIIVLTIQCLVPIIIMILLFGLLGGLVVRRAYQLHRINNHNDDNNNNELWWWWSMTVWNGCIWAKQVEFTGISQQEGQEQEENGQQQGLQQNVNHVPRQDNDVEQQSSSSSSSHDDEENETNSNTAADQPFNCSNVFHQLFTLLLSFLRWHGKLMSLY